jgi:hypothetical protein
MAARSSGIRNVLALAALVPGCIACCAIPMLAALGVGAAWTAALVWTEATWLILGAVGGVALLGTFTGLRRSRGRPTRVASNRHSVCAIDRSCCGVAGEVGGGSTACSLSNGELSDRVQAFQDLLARAPARTRRAGNAVIWRLQNLPGVEVESRRLAAPESHCCSGLKFDIDIEQREVIWRISLVHDYARDLLDFFYRLSVERE